jgi:hypothetical protein
MHSVIQRITDRFRRRMVRGKPPPYPKRAALFVTALSLAMLVSLVVAGNEIGVALIWALLIGVPAGLLVALVLPIRIRR